MAELMDYVGVMADQIGPRPVSTEEEHQTSLYIAQELTDDGLDVDVDEFATPTGTRWPYAIAFVATILGALISGVGIFVPGISLTMFVVGIVLIAAGVFIYYTEINNKPVLSKMRAGGVSQNVVARYVPSSVRREQRRRKVIVVAHVDTVRAELEAAPALIKHTALLRRIVYYTMIGIAAVTVVRLLPLPWPSVVDTVLWIISLIGCVYLLAATVCIVARRFTPYVSGGNDNASADAVLLGVAKRIVDPEERERHRAQRKADAEAREAAEQAVAQERADQMAAEQAAAQAAQQPATGQAATGEVVEEPTRAFTPVEAEAAAQQEPVVHDVQAAYAAGVVPDGAEIAYEQVEVAAEETTVIPPVAGTEGAGQPAQPAAPAADAGTPLGATQVLSRDDLDEVLGKTTAIPQPTYPEIVEDPNAAAAQQPAAGQPQQNAQPAAAQPQAQQPEGYQPLPDTLYAQTPADSVQAQVATEQPAAQPQPQQPVQPAQPAAPQPAVAQQQPAQPQQVAAQPQPAQTAAPAQSAAQPQAPAAPAPEAPQPQQPAKKKNVPSWYKAAKEKAAKDLEARSSDEDSADSASDAQPEGFRSRYAQIPVSGSMANVRRAMIQEETTAEEQGELTPEAERAEQQAAPAPAQTADAAQPATQPAAQATQAAPQQPQSQPGQQQAQQPAAAAAAPADAAAQPQNQPEPAPEPQKAPEPIDFSIFGDDIDEDISPDMSGVFDAVDSQEQPKQTLRDPNEIADRTPSAAERRRHDLEAIPTTVPQSTPQQLDATPAQAADAGSPEHEAQEPVVAANEKRGILKGLTSRIPIIGTSDELQRDSAPVPNDPDVTVIDTNAQQRARQKPERRKPTARHITQEFQPTRPAAERENESENEKLSSMRQEVAVSSTYEDTPQAGPDYDPFIPKDEQPYDAYGNATSPASSAPFPSLSNQGGPSSTGSFSSPGNSASFPSLSGSFPSLSGQIPRVNPNDFGDSYDVDYGYEPTSEDVAEDFGNPNLTGEINIPDSRFHNAMDKVSGLFSHKDKKAKKSKKQKHSKHGKRSQQPEQGYDNFDDGNVDNWDEDDDFGWKGGAYVSEDDYGRGYDDGHAEDDGYEPPIGSALEAAKARAHEIRDSVIEMTENDLLDKEVWFVALGASGAGNQGMKNFLELHGPELRGSLIINLEAIGAGTIHYVDFEGTGKSRRSDRRLQSLVRKASKTLDGVEMRPQKLEWRNTDATPAMAAGLRAMTIMGFDGAAPVSWHWPDDTSDIVSSENLEYVTELVLEMIENS